MSEEPEAPDYPRPSPYESAAMDLWDALAVTFLQANPEMALTLFREVQARGVAYRATHAPDDDGVVYQTSLYVALKRLKERMRLPEPLPEPPPGTVSLAAARARRGGTGPTGRPAA